MLPGSAASRTIHLETIHRRITLEVEPRSSSRLCGRPIVGKKFAKDRLDSYRYFDVVLPF